MARKPDFSTQATVHWFYLPPSSTLPGAWVQDVIYSLEDVGKLADLIKEKQAKEQRKIDRESGVKGGK